MKRGLIFERNSMANAYYAQGLPRIYAQLAPNLKGLYDFSERTGTKAYNLMQNLFHGTLASGGTGANATEQNMWDNAKPGGINTDATNDNVGFGDLLYTYADWNKPYTIEFWMIPATSGNLYVLTQRGDNSTGKGLYVQCRDNPIIYMYITPGSKGFFRYANPAFAPGNVNYSHYFITYTGASPYNHTCALIYCNGVAAAGYTSSAYTALDASIYTGTRANTYLGYSPNGNFYTNVNCSKLAIYDRVLTASEILTLYNYEKQFMR